MSCLSCNIYLDLRNRLFLILFGVNAQKKVVVAKEANIPPKQAGWSDQRRTCSQCASNTHPVQKENEEDPKQDVRSVGDDLQDDLANEVLEAERDKEQDVASEESQVPKNASESQKVDAQEDEKVKHCPKTNQAVAPEEAKEGKAQ